MGSNIIELAKLGHERAAELKASCGAVDVRSLAQLISDLATQLEVQFVRSTNMAVQLANAESKCRELAAESDKTSERMQQLIQIINNADNDYCMCGDAMKNHTHGGCGHPTGMFDYHYNQWLQAENKTPSTDAFLAGVRAQGVEMFADFCGEENSVFVEAKAYYRSLPDAVAEFAAQLRKGVAL
ncbi:hypothetical protein [Citrobacter cronae]|uniref:hypothetical protein n=1 Tax=Citrobacter cronae TaxID=1748967 RepID=UPI0023B25AD5|nr:hypothetical protein [Citrobacter cronae]MDE9718834.1 hypothetical protein [Citrobacter cronae]